MFSNYIGNINIDKCKSIPDHCDYRLDDVFVLRSKKFKTIIIDNDDNIFGGILIVYADDKKWYIMTHLNPDEKTMHDRDIVYEWLQLSNKKN